MGYELICMGVLTGSRQQALLLTILNVIQLAGHVSVGSVALGNIIWIFSVEHRMSMESTQMYALQNMCEITKWKYSRCLLQLGHWTETMTMWGDSLMLLGKALWGNLGQMNTFINWALQSNGILNKYSIKGVKRHVRRANFRFAKNVCDRY